MDPMRLLLALALCFAGSAFAEERTEHERFAFELFKELIESDTTHATGDTLAVSNTIAARLRAAGVPEADVVVVEYGGKGNLVARLRAAEPSAEPLLLLAHLDVVAANPLDWSVDPKRLTEKDGYYYARGTLDVKNEAAMHLANFIRIHREQLPLKRDIILALTADEESGPHNGALHLIREHRELVDAGMVINEGGGGLIKDGEYIANTVQTAEKTYQSYRLEITNRGGHSSLPRQDNAIYELAKVLGRIEAHEFPVRFNETTRAYFAGVAESAEEERASMLRGLLEQPPRQEAINYFRNEPAINARLRTTCVATQVLAGHAENALPQRASAMINCRVFPGVPVADVEQAIRDIADMPGMTITPKWDSLFSDASPLQEEIMKPIREITEDMWPGVIVMPTMSTGATDSTFFRSAGIPVYGVSGVFTDMDDNRRHGRDERIRVQSFYEGLEFLDRLTRAVAVDQ